MNDHPVAFAELESDGHIDFFYCHPDFQRQGAGTALMTTLVAEARELVLAELRAEVSVTAQPFFSKSGFRTFEERNPFIIDAPAKQYLMRKSLL